MAAVAEASRTIGSNRRDWVHIRPPISVATPAVQHTAVHRLHRRPDGLRPVVRPVDPGPLADPVRRRYDSRVACTQTRVPQRQRRVARRRLRRPDVATRPTEIVTAVGAANVAVSGPRGSTQTSLREFFCLLYYVKVLNKLWCESTTNPAPVLRIAEWRGFSELAKNVIRSSHGHSTRSLKISGKSVEPFPRNLANKKRKKER